ncbi:hypothetical protein GCM10011369_05810 [Neiella marina]|uniref:DUF1156 domain-containing protein n=1 Tax=Neiella marina TaxID=508461 RepID=A0A8J2U2I0_9GAMM|nr:DUF1156 domain-containing protein [Neiella marina]GGA67036.1 hypothetical protein GCM10011369_05810 [Neiella marina]
MTDIKIPKKLIEVALPLDDINAAAAREKSIRHGHPSTLHLWWARRPLAAARAVIFAQMVNDPGYQREIGYGVNKQEAEKKREKLFDIIRDLVKWENTNNEEVLNRARDAIWESWRETCHLNRNHPQANELFNPEKLPAFHDPFAGGGAIPLEAQRLGLESYATDLNPVAVMINKAMIEIPPRFEGREPVNSLGRETRQANLVNDWSGYKGLAEDVRRYGGWVRDRAYEQIGDLYPDLEVTEAMASGRDDLTDYVGSKVKVIAWLWARTVKSPNPAFNDISVPLASSFVLSNKKGQEAYIEPTIYDRQYKFEVRRGDIPQGAKKGTKAARGANFTCVLSGTPITGDYVKEQGQKGQMSSKLMAIVAEGKKGRIFLSPNQEAEDVARSANPNWIPETPIAPDKRALWTPSYGLETYGDLFTARQLVALETFADLLKEVTELAFADAKKAGMQDDGLKLHEGGRGCTAFGEAIAVYLGFALSKLSDSCNTIVTWKPSMNQAIHMFTRQAIPMTWDYVEPNVFAGSMGDFSVTLNNMMRVLDKEIGKISTGTVCQQDAATQKVSINKVISTDPPYYDNIGYADLSDFFYVWMRKSLRGVYPQLFATMAVPKAEELVATPYRHGSKDAAESFFLEGMTRAIENLAGSGHPGFPISIYYAFKQSETKGGSTSNTGWETFLEAVISAGLAIDGTWPMRTEMGNRMIGSGTNALASSVVLICQKRKIGIGTLSRRQFQRELRAEMPEALEAMIGGESGQTPIAPVDLAQAAIGPGMAIYSKYDAVLNQDGSKMSVHDALILINKEITEFLNPDAGSYDTDTLFCSDWFDQYGWSQGEFGIADTLARAKGTSVEGVREAGVVEAGAGKVRLLRWEDMPTGWDPKTDNRVPVWEACHHIIRELNQRGEAAAGALLARMPEQGEAIRQLAYHLYTLCERKKWAEDARAYNELITAWHAVVEASIEVGHKDEQIGLDF